jgi:hypothetical protein
LTTWKLTTELDDYSSTVATTNQIAIFNGSQYIPTTPSYSAFGITAPALSNLTDTSIITPSSFQSIYYNGTKWINSQLNFNSAFFLNLSNSATVNG